MHNILENEINLLLLQIPGNQKCRIITTIVPSFIGLPYEGISSFLHHRWNEALHKAVNAMDNKANIQHNKLMQLENSMLMYSTYNAETLEKLITTAHNIHNTTSSYERLFAGHHSPIFRTLYVHSLGLHHYSINLLLYLRTIQDKYIALYKELITQLCLYASAIRILVKGYLPNTLITPVKLKEILNEVRKTLWVTNPNYDLVIDKLHPYYNMQLVTFGIDKDKNLIVQFPIFIQPYTQQPLVLYQLETVPFLILDQNDKAQSYIQLQIKKPYIVLNSETYISLKQQELRTCKMIGYEFYCEELFVIKHKTSYNCESVIYFNLDTNIIKENCNFWFYYNKTDIIPTVLDGSSEIILGYLGPMINILYTLLIMTFLSKFEVIHNVLVNRSVLCNCGIKADNHYLLELLAACDNRNSKLTMYFMINTAFANYLDMFPNFTESLQVPLIKNRTTYKQILPINFNISGYDKALLHASTNLKDFINRYTVKKRNFWFAREAWNHSIKY